MRRSHKCLGTPAPSALVAADVAVEDVGVVAGRNGSVLTLEAKDRNGSGSTCDGSDSIFESTLDPRTFDSADSIFDSVLDPTPAIVDPTFVFDAIWDLCFA
jgi:hypothetical protein